MQRFDCLNFLRRWEDAAFQLDGFEAILINDLPRLSDDTSWIKRFAVLILRLPRVSSSFVEQICRVLDRVSHTSTQQLAHGHTGQFTLDIETCHLERREEFIRD